MKKLIAVIILILTLISCSRSLRFTEDKQLQQGKELVFLLHGLGRNRSAMWYLEDKLEEAGYLVANIGYSSIRETPEDVFKEVSTRIDTVLSRSDKVKKIHFAGHSLGGLLIRAYLDCNKVKNLGNVVLMGSPNHGTTLVDTFKDSWWFQLMGEMTMALGTGKNSYATTLKKPYYPVGVIAGVSDFFDNEDYLPGKDDGIVPLESTKVEGMQDFIVVQSNHSMMRRNDNVAKQTIEFLQHGYFIKDLTE